MRPEELQTILILSLIIFYKTEAVINGRNYNHLVQKNYDLTINKVVLTQKGYIQVKLISNYQLRFINITSRSF